MIRLVFVLAVAILAFPIGTLLSNGGPRAERSATHYMMGIADALDIRLARGEDADMRFVLIGGSSLGWSVSAETLSQELDVPVVNLGIHAGLGYRAAFDTYASRLDPARDVLVVSPEYELIRIQENFPSPLCDYLFVSRRSSLQSSICGIKNFQSRLYDQLQVWLGIKLFDPAYNRAGFNDYGDYVLHYDLPPQTLDHASRELSLETDRDAIASYLAFLEGLKDRGFALIYMPTIMAEQGCQSDAETLYRLQQVLSAPAWSEFGPDYPFCLPDTDFFNTGYHMRGPAMRRKTALFEAALKDWLAEVGKPGQGG